MTDLNTEYEYHQEILAIAENLVTEAMTNGNGIREESEEAINDYMLHEYIDGHQWVIYYAYNLDVIKYSDNDGYMEDNFGTEEAGAILADRGLSGLHTAIAFWCMYADVQEQLEIAFDGLEEEEA